MDSERQRQSTVNEATKLPIAYIFPHESVGWILESRRIMAIKNNTLYFPCTRPAEKEVTLSRVFNDTSPDFLMRRARQSTERI